MAQTPNSSTVSYASVDDFLNYYDSRLVGQLVRDDNTVASVSDLQTDPNLAAMLLQASGRLEAACVLGERYSVADLLIANGASQAMIKQIVSDLAMSRLWNRRVGPMPEHIKAQIERSEKDLDSLRNGSRIFSFVETEQAGLPQNQYYQLSQLANLNLVSSNSRYFGVLQNQKRGFF